MTPDQIRTARLNAGLSQSELARRIRVVPLTISKWERGDRTPEAPTMRALEVFFRMRVRDREKFFPDEKSA